MSIVIVGSEGSMGKRYEAILRYMGKKYMCVDKDTHRPERFFDKASAFIVATPTDTHVDLVKDLIYYRKPILCEKPITKDIKQLKALFNLLKLSRTDFCMMFQYKSLVPSIAKGDSFYDFFRTGKDGLFWDCLQIVGLSRGQLRLNNMSPIWNCQINGHRLHIDDMDIAYINFVDAWIKGHKQDHSELFDIHQKTSELAHAH